MTIDLMQLIVIIVLASLAWWANEQLNRVPVLKSVIAVLIVVLSVLLVFSSLGILSGTSSTIRVGN